MQLCTSNLKHLIQNSPSQYLHCIGTPHFFLHNWHGILFVMVFIFNLSRFNLKHFLSKMFSSIANTTFSYLLTQDEFRQKCPEHIRPSRIKLTTITMISSFSKPIKVDEIRAMFEELGEVRLHRGKEDNQAVIWSLKPTTFYNQITLTYDDGHSIKSIKIFPNGSIQVAGCEDIFNCKYIISCLVYILQCFDEDIVPPADTFNRTFWELLGCIQSFFWARQVFGCEGEI